MIDPRTLGVMAAMPDVEHLFRCPNGHLGRIDDDQLAGDVSIICGTDGCGFHGDVTDGDVVERGYYDPGGDGQR